MVAIVVNEDGYSEVLGVAEGMKEDKASRGSFFQRLRSRGQAGGWRQVFWYAGGRVRKQSWWLRCLRQFTIQESKKVAHEKARAVVEELRSMRLKETAKKVENGIE